MSTEQLTLQETQSFKQHRSQRRREIILAEGGIYGRDVTTEHEPDTPTGVCLHCGRNLPAGLARVIGDNQGNTECCANCRIGPGNEPYDRDVTAIRRFRAGVGKWDDEGER
jgi:hypothetical protein